MFYLSNSGSLNDSTNTYLGNASKMDIFQNDCKCLGKVAKYGYKVLSYREFIKNRVVSRLHQRRYHAIL